MANTTPSIAGASDGLGDIGFYAPSNISYLLPPPATMTVGWGSWQFIGVVQGLHTEKQSIKQTSNSNGAVVLPYGRAPADVLIELWIWTQGHRAAYFPAVQYLYQMAAQGSAVSISSPAFNAIPGSGGRLALSFQSAEFLKPAVDGKMVKNQLRFKEWLPQNAKNKTNATPVSNAAAAAPAVSTGQRTAIVMNAPAASVPDPSQSPTTPLVPGSASGLLA